MAIPTNPAVADTPPWKNIAPLLGTPVQLTSNVTNTATSATLVTGWTSGAITVPSRVKALKVTIQADSVSNSGANSVILTLWSGTVGSGTQLGQSSASAAASGGLAPVNFTYYVPITSTQWGTAITYNIGMHGSGAGTNTLVGSATAPASMWVEAM